MRGGGLAPAGKGMWIMPRDEVEFILSVERDRIPDNRRESLLEHQALVRRQYEANDDRVVLLDDDMAARNEDDDGRQYENSDLSVGDQRPIL